MEVNVSPTAMSTLVQPASGGNHSIYFTEGLCRLSISPTRSYSLDEIAKVHLDREGDGNTVPCSDLLECRVSEVVTDLLQACLTDEDPRYWVSLVPI